MTLATEPVQTTSGFWKVQLWLGDRLVEEHVAPTKLAQMYADVIRLRIAGLSDRRLKCEPVSLNELAYPEGRPYDPRD